MLKRCAAIAVLCLAAGCASNTTAALDPDRILHMAGEEAGQIAAPRERLARQLNIANRETETGKSAEARKTLAKARETLEQAPTDALSEQQRLAGWISLSELARNADDKAFANGALDRAMKALAELNPQPARCEYVLGIEAEVKVLRGPADAAKLLVAAGDWAMELPQQPMRRGAFFAFAHELFACNDYEGARTVLRKDQDAAWRSDALTVLSSRARWETRPASGSIGFAMAKMPTMAPMADGASRATDESLPGSIGSLQTMPTSFGKPLDFKTNYLRP